MLTDAIIFLAAAVLSVPLLQRLGFGAILGYLFAGILIGPWGLGLIHEVGQVLDFAELGIVLLLFIIGLELTPKRLSLFRHSIFVLGGAQVLFCGLPLFLVAGHVGLDREAALVVAFGLALSSTAFAIQLLSEHHLLHTRAGRKAFSILLFQDLAVVPMLAVLPLLGGRADTTFDWGGLGVAIAVIAGLVVAGRPLISPLLRFIALTRSAEIFTAATLLFVFGLAALVHELGLSMALGAFLAGILLAESEYRHQIEAEIQPFRGLLMGLFFMAVGMTIDLDLLLAAPVRTLAIVTAYMAIKVVIILGVGLLYTREATPSLLIAGTLSQGGEFAFVIFGLAREEGLLDAPIVDTLILAVCLSMVLTPLCFRLFQALSRRFGKAVPAPPSAPEGERRPTVLIAGFGRVGQIVGKVLAMREIPYTAIDLHPEAIQLSGQRGQRLIYGDPCKPDLLRAAGAEQAELIVVTLADPEESIRCIEMILTHFPHLRIIARARNRQHSRQLIAYDIDFFTRETFESSVLMGEKALELLGVDRHERREAVQDFRRQDTEQLLAPIRQLSKDDMELPDRRQRSTTEGTGISR